jgi:autotransporter-associated beta strand protein
LSETALLKARVLCNGTDWSPLQEATFTVPFLYPNFISTLPSAPWSVNANWSTSPQPYPNGVGSSAQINSLPGVNRDVTLGAAITNSTLFFNLQESPYRIRVRDTGLPNPFTFTSSSGNPTVIVDGTGGGWADFDVNAGLQLLKSLRLTVNSPTGSLAYGALRMRGSWSGIGGLLKDGVGVASLTGSGKTFTGSTFIYRGVLQCEPVAAPLNSLLVQVNNGGQLRLSSSGDYAFGTALRLNGYGRGGPLPDVPGLGLEGAIRFQPGTSPAYATITTPLVFLGAAAIHVEGASNTLALVGTMSSLGPLARLRSFIKTGDGKLIIFSFTTNYTATATVSNGTLAVYGAISMPLQVEAGASLSGAGKVGSVQGSGRVLLDKEILTVSSAVGMNYSLAFGAPVPSYATATTSGNGLLKVDVLQHGTSNSVIDLYLDSPLFEGATFRGGFFSAQGDLLRSFLTNAVFRYFVPDPQGGHLFSGRAYSPYSGEHIMKITSVPELADFAEGVRLGHVMELRVSGNPIDYDEWVQRNFLPEEWTIHEIAGPFAITNCTLPNLLRYASNMKRADAVTNQPLQFLIEEGVPVCRFLFDPGKLDLTYQVEGSPSVTGSWSRVLFNSRTDSPYIWVWDGERLSIRDEASGPGLEPTYFYRFRTILDY